MKKLTIGVDIDNVIADSTPSYIAKFNEVFGTSVVIDNVTDFYHLEKNTKIDLERVVNFIETTVHTHEFQLSIQPYQDPIGIIKEWGKRGHIIHYITARPTSIKKSTIKWLKKHGFILSGTKVHLQDYKVYKRDVEFKKDVVEKLEIDIMIEDNRDIAKAMDIPVFLIDKPWNQGALSQNIHRVYGWSEIEEFVSEFSS